MLHQDLAAVRSAHALGTRAFALQGQVHFGAEAPPLDTLEGQRLLAHELVHVAQQRQGTRAAAGDEPLLPGRAAAEREAHHLSRRLTLEPSSAPLAVHEHMEPNWPLCEDAPPAPIELEELGAWILPPGAAPLDAEAAGPMDAEAYRLATMSVILDLLETLPQASGMIRERLAGDPLWMQQAIEHLAGSPYFGWGSRGWYEWSEDVKWRNMYKDYSILRNSNVCDELSEMTNWLRGLSGFGGGNAGQWSFYLTRNALHEGVTDLASIRPGATLFYLEEVEFAPSENKFGLAELGNHVLVARRPGARAYSGRNADLSWARDALRKHNKYLDNLREIGPEYNPDPEDRSVKRLEAADIARLEAIHDNTAEAGFMEDRKLIHSVTVMRVRGEGSDMRFDLFDHNSGRIASLRDVDAIDSLVRTDAEATRLGGAPTDRIAYWGYIEPEILEDGGKTTRMAAPYTFGLAQVVIEPRPGAGEHQPVRRVLRLQDERSWVYDPVEDFFIMMRPDADMESPRGDLIHPISHYMEALKHVSGYRNLSIRVEIGISSDMSGLQRDSDDPTEWTDTDHLLATASLDEQGQVYIQRNAQLTQEGRPVED